MRYSKALTRTLLASSSIILLTIFHHVYGAVIYATPWRYHVADVALPVLFLLVLAYAVHRWRAQTWIGKASLWFFMSLALLFPILTIGFFEGGYNHLLKDILYFASAGQNILRQLFPAPKYEMPDNVVFEVTGVLQFFAGLYAAYWLVGLWRQIHERDDVRESEIKRGSHEVSRIGLR